MLRRSASITRRRGYADKRASAAETLLDALAGLPTFLTAFFTGEAEGPVFFASAARGRLIGLGALRN
jgi:hypothetical protein